jgi:DNA replication and repair protein RecF
MTANGGAAPPRVALRRLQLADFRNYPSLALEFGSEPVVFTGDNGAGKTNLLEAISFLAPGRGLRRARLAEVARNGGTGGFAVHARLEGPYGEAEIGTGTAPMASEAGRRVRINGANAASAEALMDWSRIIWITPAMDGLFSGPAADRRRFLDRLVLAIDPGHGRRAVDYEKAMKSRNRLIEDRSDNPAWFEAIEVQMAETATAMAAARHELVRLLSAQYARLGDDGPFPFAGLSLSGMIEEMIGERPAVEVEEAYRRALAQGRERDRAAGRTLEGPHRTDLLVMHGPKAMPAELCSTGEQKALLVGTVLAHARLVGEMAGMAPILLLDEIAAHLDGPRRRALFTIVEGLNCQAFATGTDRGQFDTIAGPVQHFAVAEGKAVRTDGA